MANKELLDEVFRDVELYKDIIDNLDEGIYIVDNERTILFWSKSAERITLKDSSEMVGRQCFNSGLDHKDLKGNNLCTGFCPLVGSMYDGKSREATVSMVVNNETKYLKVRTFPLIHNGHIIGAYEIFKAEEGDFNEKR